MKADERGIAELVAVVIMIAITVAVSPALIKITEDIGKSITASPSSVSSYVSISDEDVIMVNPTPVAINLSSVVLEVNGVPVQLNDEDGDGMWEPYESVTFNTAVLNQDIVVISLRIDGEEVYRAVYARPTAFPGDKEFPVINFDVNVTSQLLLNISVSDDTAAASLRVVEGTLNGSDVSETDLHTSNIIDKVAQKYDMSVSSVLAGLKNNTLAPAVDAELKNYNETVSIASIGTFDYLKIVTKDITGKTSTKIISYSELLPKINISSPGMNDIFWTITNSSCVGILASVSSASHVWMYVDGNLVLDTNTTGGRLDINTTPCLALGNHTVTIRAENIVGNTSESVNFTISRDYPPTIRITKPADGQAFVPNNGTATINITAVVTDDRGTPVVDFYVDGVYIGSDTAPPYEITTNVSMGPHNITAVATDIMNQTATDSVSIMVGVDFPPDVSILLPAESDSLPDDVQVLLVAAVSDDIMLNTTYVYVDGFPSRAILHNSNYTLIVERFNLPAGNHTITVVTKDSSLQQASATVNFTVYAARPPSIRIMHPFSSEIFTPGDPWMGVVTWDDEWHDASLALDSSWFNLTASMMTLSRPVYSIGPVFMVGSSSISVPNPGVSGTGNVTVSIIPATEYKAAAAFRPITKSGVADSRGRLVELTLLTDSVVQVTLVPLTGNSTGRSLEETYDLWGGIYGTYIHTQKFAFSFLEGAVPTKLSVSMKFTTYGSGGMFPSGYYWYYISISNVGTIKSGSLSVPEDTSKIVNYVSTDTNLINNLVGGNQLVITSYDSPALVARSSFDNPPPSISYYTRTAWPKVYADGLLKLQSQWLDLNTGPVKNTFTLGPGKHTLKFESDSGAFLYRVRAYPIARDPPYINVQAPFGNFTVSPGEAITYSGDLNSLFGTYGFSVPYGLYLVEVRYDLSGVRVI